MRVALIRAQGSVSVLMLVAVIVAVTQRGAQPLAQQAQAHHDHYSNVQKE